VSDNSRRLSRKLTKSLDKPVNDVGLHLAVTAEMYRSFHGATGFRTDFEKSWR